MIQYYINARILTLDEQNYYIENGYVKVKGMKIESVGPMSIYQQMILEKEAKVEDVQGKIIMPGMVCTHSHFYGQLIRGMAVRRHLRNWQQVLQDLWWNVDRSLDEEMNYASALMGLTEGIKCGVTTFIDHHASPRCCPGSLDTLEQAAKEIGARAVLSYEVSDRNGEKSCKEGLEENLRFIEKCRGRNQSDTVRAMFGLHALYSLSERTLQEAAEMEKAYDVGFHIHCAEDKADVVCSYKNYDMHVVEKLEKMGILKKKSILAHFVHTDREEWGIVSRTGATVAHNPQSNASNGVGICPAEEMLNNGVHVALGGDGFYYNLFEELKIAVLLQKLKLAKPDGMSGAHVLKLAFENPYRVVENAFNISAGKITAGRQADFIMVSYDPPTPLHADNFIAHMTDAFTGNVTDAIVNGNRILKDNVVLHMPKDAYKICRKQAARLEKRFAEM